MVAVQKHVIYVKHIFKHSNMPNDTYLLCLSEIFVTNIQISPRLEILTGSDVVTANDQKFQNKKLQV